MRTQLLFALALLPAMPLAALAQTAPTPVTPAAPAVTPAGPSVTLRYKFAPGQVRRYNLSMDMDGQMFMGQTGAALPLKTSTLMTLR